MNNSIFGTVRIEMLKKKKKVFYSFSLSSFMVFFLLSLSLSFSSFFLRHSLIFVTLFSSFSSSFSRSFTFLFFLFFSFLFSLFFSITFWFSGFYCVDWLGGIDCDWLWWWLGCVVLATHNGRSWVIFQIGFLGFGLWLLLYHGGGWKFCGGSEYFCKWICLGYLVGFVWFCFELCLGLWAAAVVVGWWQWAVGSGCCLLGGHRFVLGWILKNFILMYRIEK